MAEPCKKLTLTQAIEILQGRNRNGEKVVCENGRGVPLIVRFETLRRARSLSKTMNALTSGKMPRGLKPYSELQKKMDKWGRQAERHGKHFCYSERSAINGKEEPAGVEALG